MMHLYKRPALHCRQIVTNYEGCEACDRSEGEGVYLDQLVPTSRDNDGVTCDRAEAHAGHPLGVTVWLTNGVLALPKSVP